MVLLALVDGQYRFRWVDLGSQGSCSDAQIFNSCQLKDKIEELELIKDIQQDMLAILQEQVGADELEKHLPEQLFKQIQKAAKKLK